MKKNRIYISLLCFLLVSHLSYAQVYEDYIGAGHSAGITVTSSNSNGDSQDINSLNGDGMDARAMEASRFLAQSTLGHNMEMIDGLKENLDYESWIDEQMAIPSYGMLRMLNEVWEDALQLHLDAGEDEEEVFGPYFLHFNYAWWQNFMTQEDLLRQRVSYALSQILVISMRSDLGDHVDGTADYYDLLNEHAFGNYEDLLLDVTLHPAMGFYLSHLNNPKADPVNNVHPDENYAREIMQLFSIGLYELNLDGSRKLDVQGKPIPTYDNTDIREFAKVFTGLGPGAVNDNVDWTNDPYFGLDLYGADVTVPMRMFNFFHESGPKRLLNGFTIPANQDGMLDIEQTVNHLFNHDNVGPFLARRLIQRLVKSNPTPGYISRVASTFNNNGSGVRGDMGSVVKAILLDDEARTCEALSSPESGMLREPVIRLTQMAKSLDVDFVENGRYWNNGYDYARNLRQFPMFSPSVFNFYTPDFSPVGDISAQGLVAPEFKIHDSSTSINYLNETYASTIWNILWYSWHGDYGVEEVGLNLNQLQELIGDKEEMLNYMDILYTYGQLTDFQREEIIGAIEPITWDDPQNVRSALYLLLVSPDYTILK
jgi:uncharacterized protein (DUF1800 family)